MSPILGVTPKKNLKIPFNSNSEFPVSIINYNNRLVYAFCGYSIPFFLISLDNDFIIFFYFADFFIQNHTFININCKFNFDMTSIVSFNNYSVYEHCYTQFNLFCLKTDAASMNFVLILKMDGISDCPSSKKYEYHNVMNVEILLLYLCF